jgi:adenylate cyclase
MTASHLARESQAAQIPPQEIRDQLNRILDSSEFRATARRKAFLDYVLEEYIAGHYDRLKGFTIALAVFGRDAKFDPQLDPIVRLEAGRLRRDLEHYYLTAGHSDPIIIDLPKGAYIPVINRRDSVVEPVGALRPPETSWAATQHVFSIAVMRFAMVNGGPEFRYFADGLSQEVAKSLSRFQSISVVLPGSLIAARGTDGRNKRTELSYILEGEAEKGAATIKVSARLVDAVSSQLIWAESYEKEFDTQHVFEIREDISLKIAANVGGNYGALTRSFLAKGLFNPPEHLQSFDCVLRFYQHQHIGWAQSHARVRDCLERVVERDSHYAAAWANLAYIYAQEYRLGLNPTPDRRPVALERALTAAERAVELAPGSATAYVMLATVHFDREDYATFRRMGETAMWLGPGDPDVLAHFGMRLAFLGDWERGVRLVEKALDLSPYHPHWFHYPVAFHYYLQGDYERAMLAAEKVRPVGVLGSDFFAAMCFAKSGEPERAREVAGRLMAAHPDASAKFWGVMRGYKFRPDAAESLADGLRKAGVPIGPPTDSDPNAEANAACLEIGDLGGPSVLVPVATDRLEYRAKC